MREEVARIDFDVAIVGAGAYGLPLAAAVKDLGRQAVHLGGATQLLFGIRGRRWEVESPDDIAPLFNEHWVRPSAEETPQGSSSVEGGCYW
jgi:ketopantoate reductase